MHDSPDVTLACDDDKQIQTHKVVLSARAGVHIQMIFSLKMCGCAKLDCSAWCVVRGA